MSDAECARIGGNARRWFLSNKEGFANRVNAAASGCDFRLGKRNTVSTCARAEAPGTRRHAVADVRGMG